MAEDDDKILPKDDYSDNNLPGHFEESNTEDFIIDPIQTNQKNRIVLVIAIALVIVSLGSFSYYFMNQNEIDSRLIENTYVNPERDLVNQYNVGEYGTDHAHAAIIVYVDDVKINFGLPQFQLASKYIHFENKNPYTIHKHAVGVPLEMLFASVGMKVTTDCIFLNYYESNNIEFGTYCTEQNQLLSFYVNGEKYYSNISEYVIEHDDRILMSYGDVESIIKQLEYLESLRISDVPKNNPEKSGNNITI